MHGGADDQAIGTSQSNVQSMVAAANVGNGSFFGGPTNIQSDNTFTQTASNSNTATNVDRSACSVPRPGPRGPCRLLSPSTHLQARTHMKSLHISDLSVNKELDGKAMSAVRGGADDQAVGTSQLNLQSMLAAANVGNGMVVGANSPVIIQSDNTFSQDADNSNTPSNKSLLLAAFFGR